MNKPQLGEIYYVPSFMPSSYQMHIWSDDFFDNYFYKSGLIHDQLEKAQEHSEKLIEFSLNQTQSHENQRFDKTSTVI